MFSVSFKTICRFRLPKNTFSVFSRIFKQTKEQANQKQQSKTESQQNKKETQQTQEDDYDLFSRQKETLRNIDYAKLHQSSKQIPENVGEGGIQQIIFWADGIESPQQILRMVQLFNKYWNQQASQITSQSYKFQQFCNKVVRFSYLSKDFQSLNKVAQFGVLYDIREEELWNKLQQKALSLIQNQLNFELFFDIVLKFVKMRQGDMIYYKAEDLAESNILSLGPASASKVLFMMFERNSGDIKTIKTYLNRFIQTIDRAETPDLVLLSTFLPYIKIQNKKQILAKIQAKLLQNQTLQKVNLQELSVIAKCFGNQNGSEEFWKIVQSRLLQKQQLTKNQAEQILYGPLNSYRISLEGASKMTSLIMVHLSEMRAVHLSQLSKIIYIYELDNQQTFQKIQGKIIEELQDLQATPLEQLMQICKNYSITRHGSRDIYKMLEVVIMTRMEQIKLNRKVFVALYNIYNRSDLCSAQMIKEFAKYR